MTVGDFNGDGKADLAVTCGNFDFLAIFLGKGDGTFTQKTIIPTGLVPWRVAIGDFNGDGIADLAVANSSNTVTILLGTETEHLRLSIIRKLARAPIQLQWAISMATASRTLQ